jgi:hypothetical protein
MLGSDLVTTKPEQENAGAPVQTAAASEQAPRPEAGEGSAPQALPSVIVDPSASVPAPSSSANESGNGASHGPSHDAVATPTASSQSTEPQTAPLSPDDADRFASRFRPSWEASAVGKAGIAQGPTAMPQASTPVTAAAMEPDLEISEFPGARQRRRNLLLAGGAIAGFAVLSALALMSGKPSASHLRAPKPEAPMAEPEPMPTAAMPAQPSEPPAAAEPEQPRAAEAPLAAAVAAPSAPPPQPVDVPPAIAAAPPAQPVAAEQKRAEQPTLVRIHITTSPLDAELTLDGAPVPNPFETSMPKGGKHRVVARADGYHSREVLLKFDRDQETALQLDKRQAPPAARPKPAPVAAAARPHPIAIPLRPTPAPVRRPPPTTAPAPTKGAGFVTESPY